MAKRQNKLKIEELFHFDYGINSAIVAIFTGEEEYNLIVMAGIAEACRKHYSDKKNYIKGQVPITKYEGAKARYIVISAFDYFGNEKIAKEFLELTKDARITRFD